MSEEELKRCPFCANEAKRNKRCVDMDEGVDQILVHSIVCTKCKASTDEQATIEGAVRGWNSRWLSPHSKLDIHILLDAYYALNGDRDYDPELDEAIQDIHKNWNYKRVT